MLLVPVWHCSKQLSEGARSSLEEAQVSQAAFTRSKVAKLSPHGTYDFSS